MEYCSHIWGGAPRSHGLDLVDRVQKRVGSGLSSDSQALLHRRDVASFSLFYKYYYGKCSSEHVDMVPPKHVRICVWCEFAYGANWHMVRICVCAFLQRYVCNNNNNACACS